MKAIKLLALLLFAGPLFAADYSDNFNRADNAAISASWVEPDDGLSLSGNELAFVQSKGLAIYNSSTTGVNQYVKLNWSDAAAVNEDMPQMAFRYTSSGVGYYTVDFQSWNNLVDWRYHSSVADNTGTSIGTASTTLTANDTWGCTLDGTGTSTVVRCWLSPGSNTPTNATTWAGDSTPEVTITNDPGTPVNTGNLTGLGYDTGNPFSGHMDDWFGGDIPSGGGGGTAVPVFIHHYRDMRH